MKNHILALALFPLIMSILISCGGEKSTNNPPADIVTAPEPDTEVNSVSQAKAKITDILSAYYTDLASEQLNENEYFAPQLEHFFTSKSISREKVGQSIRSSFESVKDRHITFDPKTLRIQQTPEGYVSEFSGQSIHTRTSDGQTVSTSFNNRVSFNKDFQIIAYGDQNEKNQQNTRSLAQKSAEVSLVQQAQNMAKEVIIEFKEGDFRKSPGFIHPKYGFYLIGQPGAYSVPYHLNSFDEIFKKAPWLEKGTDMYTELKAEAIPKFTCEGDNYFDKAGCFIAESKKYNGLTSLMKALRQADFEDFGPSVVSTASNIENLVMVEVVETKSGTAFYFGEEAGKWYLLIVDMASYSCSA